MCGFQVSSGKTRIVKDMQPAEIAQEIFEWIRHD